jgi:cobalt-zinc-cadmium efflux system outer membrane protein
MSSKTLRGMVACTCVLAISSWLNAAEVSSANTSQLTSQRALAALVREVLNSNPAVQAAQAAVNAAQARERAASRPLYNPALALNLEQSAEDTQALGLDQTIDWANKREARTKVASYVWVATRAKLVTVRQRLSGELLSALARLQTARALARLAQRRADGTQRLAALSQQRYQAGDLNQVSLELARLAHAQAKLQRAQAVSDVIQARRALAAVAGDVDRNWPSLPKNLPTLARGALDLETLLNELPVLRAQRARIAAARSAVELSARRRTPDPTIGLRGGSQENEALIGIGLSLPLFVRNNFSAEVDVANANLIRTQRRAQNIYRRAKARLASALRQYRVTRRARLAWEQTGQRSMSTQIDLLRRLWQAGELSTTDFLVQLNQALNTQASAIGVRGRAWRAWFEWLTASGRIDDWLGLRRP